MAKPRSKRVLYDTDVIVRDIFLSLLSDCGTQFNDPKFEKIRSTFLLDIQQFRELVYPDLGVVEPHRFKLWKQVENMLKKYRFAVDAFSDKELHDLTLEKYFKEQVRILTTGVRSTSTHQVLQQARKIARSILGKYVPENTIKHSRFGKKSSIGCPLDVAYLDIKLSKQAAFTSSSKCAEIFFNHIMEDEILSEIVSKIDIDKDKLAHETLNLICVPKSWKTYRLITPLTLLSLFYSNGLGGYMAERLSANGLHIPKLQNRHKNLIKQYSSDLSHTTADLSAASDSITVELLNAILPRDWFTALKPLFTHTVVHDNSVGRKVSSYTATILPMGNGVTFPLETLVFYCLIRAIGTLTGTRGTYSVYGDDLIYPSRIHKYVCHIFPKIGLTLNLDKTFVNYPFRESCGSDFYREHDVRSFYFDGTSQRLPKLKYLAFLHKTFNSLRSRWSVHELPITFARLLTEICRFGPVMRVPPRYPDEAGIKVGDPDEVPMCVPGVTYSEVRLISGNTGVAPWFGSVMNENHNWLHTFTCIEFTSKRRVVKVVMPYYWLSLQGLTDDLSEGYLETLPFSRQSSLRWTKLRRIRTYKGKNGKVRKKKITVFRPTVDSRMGGRYRMSDGSTSEWI